MVVDLLFYVPIIVCGGSVLVFVLVCVSLFLSNFTIILTKKRGLVVLLLLSFVCLGTVNVLLLFLTVPWVVLHFLLLYFLIILTYFLI